MVHQVNEIAGMAVVSATEHSPGAQLLEFHFRPEPKYGSGVLPLGSVLPRHPTGDRKDTAHDTEVLGMEIRNAAGAWGQCRVLAGSSIPPVVLALLWLNIHIL